MSIAFLARISYSCDSLELHVALSENIVSLCARSLCYYSARYPSILTYTTPHFDLFVGILLGGPRRNLVNRSYW